MSVEQTDQEAAAVAVAPRVKLSDIESAIGCEYYMTGNQAVSTGTLKHPALDVLSICILVMRNGFTVIGKSAPASSENFNAALGFKFAREDAIRQLWPLMGFALREKLAAAYLPALAQSNQVKRNS